MVCMTTFDYQPRLGDGAVSLRPMHVDDWKPLYAVARDPAIWAVYPARDRWKEASFRTTFEESLASARALVVEDAVTGEVIGSSRYDRKRAEAEEIEIGWTFLARERWGGAYNGAIKRLMIAHALGTFERVIFLIGEDNGRSRRALEKIGGTLMARYVDTIIEGRPVRHVIYGIDRAGFAEGPLAKLEG